MSGRILLHEGGHGHEGCCCGSHEHHHDHEHEHAASELSPEQVLALMDYMLDHNSSHTDELHNVGHALEAQSKLEAADLLFDAVHYYTHGNEKLAEALKLLKEE